MVGGARGACQCEFRIAVRIERLDELPLGVGRRDGGPLCHT